MRTLVGMLAKVCAWFTPRVRSAIRLTCSILVAFSLTAFGIFHLYPLEVIFPSEEQVVDLDPAVAPVSHRLGMSHQIQLNRLPVNHLADNVRRLPEPKLAFFENGVPLKYLRSYVEPETKPGLFIHWDQSIIFSRPNGGPLEPGTVYSIRFPRLLFGNSWLPIVFDPRLLWWVSLALL